MMMSDVLGAAGEERHLGVDERLAHLLARSRPRPRPPPSKSNSRNSPPRLSTCSRDAARVSKARTIAPRPRAADRGEPRDARADDQHLRGRHLAGGRHLPVKKRPKCSRRLDHRAVAGDVRHRGERVHLLRAGDARHGVHREDRRLARAARRSISSLFCAGQMKQMSAPPSLSRSASCFADSGVRCSGARTLRTMSASARRSRRPGRLRAPASSYAVGEGGGRPGARLDEHLEPELASA